MVGFLFVCYFLQCHTENSEKSFCSYFFGVCVCVFGGFFFNLQHIYLFINMSVMLSYFLVSNILFTNAGVIFNMSQSLKLQ